MHPKLAIGLLAVITVSICFIAAHRLKPGAASANEPRAPNAATAPEPSAASAAAAPEPRAPGTATASEPPAPDDVAAPPTSTKLTSSGVASRVLKSGRGSEHPAGDDVVTFHFETWTREGKLLGSTRQRGAPDSLNVRRMMPGVGEVVRRMSVGEARRIWVPQKLTAFPSDDDDAAPPFPDVTVDVELLALQRAPAVPPLTAPPNARRTLSGLRYKFERRGAGQSLKYAPRVQFHESGWSADGKLFESTVMAGQPRIADLSNMIAGLAEGIRLMRVGDKALFWLPAALAFGDHPRRNRVTGPVIFEVELLGTE
jgi:FKBP-type peptidyl-prolyl cis-trans isomerase